MTFRLYPGVPDDFEARIRILAPEEGGRRSPARNGIRWDFAYADDAGTPELFMIWPDFRHAEGDSWATAGRPSCRCRWESPCWPA